MRASIVSIVGVVSMALLVVGGCAEGEGLVDAETHRGQDTATADTGAADSQGATDAPDATDSDGPHQDTADVGEDDIVVPTLGLCDPNTNIPGESLMLEAGNDWPDCVVDCPQAAHVGLVEINVGQDGFTGAIGRIDDDAHAYDGLTTEGPDVDIIPFRAAPRTMLEFAVLKRGETSIMDPMIYVSDGFQVRTFNSDYGPNTTCARTTIAFPFTSDVPIYVVIEESANYEAWTPEGWTETRGGSNYGYQLRYRTSPFAPHEIGDLIPGQIETITGQGLSEVGELRYYRFYATPGAKPTVTVTRTGGDQAFRPTVAGFKTDLNQLVWQIARSDEDGDGVVTIDGDAFRVCQSCGPNPVEFIFAVQDWNGMAGPEFTYDIRIVLP